jgi:hypothetical protein
MFYRVVKNFSSRPAARIFVKKSAIYVRLNVQIGAAMHRDEG